jgi:NAD(P)-dependent dehydrogenase (short-subunit alcohol dehydrogenase family)
LISSVAGFRGLPRALAYGASKAAMTHIAEALVYECQAANVSVQVIHPGFVRTPLTDKNDFKMPFLMESADAAQRRFTYQLKLLRMLPYAAYFALVSRATRGR